MGNSHYEGKRARDLPRALDYLQQLGNGWKASPKKGPFAPIVLSKWANDQAAGRPFQEALKL